MVFFVCFDDMDPCFSYETSGDIVPTDVVLVLYCSFYFIFKVWVYVVDSDDGYFFDAFVFDAMYDDAC